MHRHPLRPDLSPPVGPDSGYFFYMIVALALVVVLWVVLLLVLLVVVVVVLAVVVVLVAPVVLVVLLPLPLLLALGVPRPLGPCAGVGTLGASSAFAEPMVALAKGPQVVGSTLLDLLRVGACAGCCGASCVCAYAKCPLALLLQLVGQKGLVAPCTLHPNTPLVSLL